MNAGVLDGGLMLLYVDNVAVAYSTNVQVTPVNTLRESPNKDDGGWTKRYSGRKDVTGSCSYLAAFATDAGGTLFNFVGIINQIFNGTEVTIKISTEESGDYSFSGPALFEQASLTFGNLGEDATGDISFKASGAWSTTVIT